MTSRSRSRWAAVLVGTDLALGGCVPLLVADVASEAASGKTVDEHALSAVTQKDCNVLQGALRADRRVCEEHGSPATERDFKGLGQHRRSNATKERTE